MSGINTLIDTLLHSVLGKRVDIPPPQPLNAPVRPVSGPDAPLAVRSDSRLETGGVPLRGLPQPGTKAAPTLPQTPQPAPLSTETRFSPAARAIAELLARFPSPPSVLVSTRPLVSAAEGFDPAVLSSRLQASIGESGLFYEHHLQRWYRGEMTLQQLAREPQMQWLQATNPGGQAGASQGSPTSVLPSVNPAAGRTFVGPDGLYTPFPVERAGREGPEVRRGVETAPPASSTSAASASQPPLSALTRAAASLEAGADAAVMKEQESSSAESRRTVGLPENLQSIVRHQLELLSVPVLRWEGDIWSGLFLALVIQLPTQPGEEQRESDAADQDDAEEQSWRSELRLEISGLGELRVHLRLLGNRLDLSLTAQTLDVMSRLEAGKEDLVARLEGTGLVAPQVRVLLRPAEGPGEEGDRV